MMVRVAEPAPLTTDGLKEGVAPEGRPVTKKEMVGAGSLPGMLLMVKVVLEPPRTEAEALGVRRRKGWRKDASPPCESVS